MRRRRTTASKRYAVMYVSNCHAAVKYRMQYCTCGLKSFMNR